MVGLSGVVGPGTSAHDPQTVAPTVEESATTYRDEGIVVRAASHAGTTGPQPAEGPDGTLVWVFGEVFSVTHGGERRSVDPARTAEVCAAQHAAHGPDFVEALDGEFAGLLYDPRNGTATLFTDRVGARPLYYAIGDHTLAFSTSVQTVPEPRSVAFAFDDAYLSEYLYARRVFGTRTPVKGIEQLPPATVATYGPEAGETERRRYWTPRHRPADRPVTYFVREFRERFERAVADRMPRADGEYGLLMSGGSDSRAVLAAADPELTAYHLADGENRESRVARRASVAGGARFERLDRGADYHETLLERAAPIQEFVGPFHTGHALGFAERIADETDALLTGLYSDDLFGAWSVPQKELDLPFGVTLYPPFVERPANPEAFVGGQVSAGPTRRPSYLSGPDYAEILRANTERRDDGVVFHGVSYESLDGLSLHTSLFPVTNGVGFDLFSALQIAPTRNPFLDRGLLDLHLEMPLEHRLRHDVVAQAVSSLDPALGRIPHAGSRLPLSYPKAAHAVGKRVTNQLDKLGPDSYRTDGPWQDRDEVVRNTAFVGEALDANEAKLRALDCVDAEEARRTYRRHRARETDAAEELYRLVSVLETPLADRLLGE